MVITASFLGFGNDQSLLSSDGGFLRVNKPNNTGVSFLILSQDSLEVSAAFVRIRGATAGFPWGGDRDAMCTQTC